MRAGRTGANEYEGGLVSETQPTGADPTGADRLVGALDRLGVDVVFGLPGVHNLSIWEAMAETHIRIIGVRHEQTAAYAADGYARATGKLGVALVTTGPGAANTVCAVGEARTVGSPILVIATDIDTKVRQPGVFRGAMHECRDQEAMFVALAKGTLTVASPDTVAAGVFATRENLKSSGFHRDSGFFN